MAITYVNGDISTSDNVSVVTGVSWTGLGHASGDVAFCIWALLQTATTVTLDADLTSLDNHVDQNLRSILSDRSMTGAESGTLTFSVDSGSLNRMAVALGIWRGVDSVGTPVRFTEAGTAVASHPAANNLSITPTADNALILLVYSERSSSGNTAGTLAPPAGPGGGSATVRVEKGTGNSGGTYVQIAEFQLGTGTAGNAQAFTQWVATPGTLTASNADMWLIPLYPPAGTDATPTPAAVATVTATPQATPSAGATQAPAATTATVATPQALASAGSVAAPATVNAATTLPQVVASISDSQAPSPVAAAVSLPQATISVGATPATTSMVVAAPSSNRNVSAGPSAFVAVVTTPQATPAVAGNATATPSAIAGSISVPAAVPSGGAVRSPAVLITTVSAPQATTSVGTSATATPSPVSVVVAFPQALPVGAASAHPAVLIAFAGAPGASPAIGASRTPSVITSVVGLPQLSRSGGAAVSPGLLQVLLAFPQASGPSPVFTPLRDPVLTLHANASSLGVRANSASVSVRPNNAEAS